MKLRNILISGDLFISIAIAAVVYIATPHRLPTAVVKDILGIAVAVIAIIFAVFVASFAITISASDNEFVSFLEESRGYSRIIKTNHFVLRLQFVALVLAVLFYGAMAFAVDAHTLTEPKLPFIVYSFIFFYSLLAAMYSTLDTVKYADFRARFLRARHPLKDLERPQLKNPQS